jgi:hypothetical protein
MGTRTEILKIAADLRGLAAKNPAVAPGLHGIVAELEACAERADQKRMEKKKAVKGLLTTLQAPAAAPAAGPKANFLSTVVAPKLTDRTLVMQLIAYEKAVMTQFQTMSSILRGHDAALAAVRRNFD